MPTVYDSDYWYSRQPYYRKSEARWQQSQPPPDAEIAHSVLLLGDTGFPNLDGRDPVLNMAARQIAAFGSRLTVVFLGDNVYPRGLPAVGHRLREVSEARLRAQLDVFDDFSGKLVYLSGNHDWNRGKSDGYEYVARQEAFIREYTGRTEVFLPAGGCPGPVTLPLADGLHLLVVNTQWWVQRGFRPIGAAHGCEARNETHFYELLENALSALRGQRVLVAGHHPLYSNALHGGRFTLKQHLFPLTAVHKRLYVPLPVAGSLYPLYRRVFGAYEDMSHPWYKHLRRRMLSVLKRYDNIVYAAGHDHNLQYFHRHGNHFIVSGAGSKTAYVHKGGKASFTHAHQGGFRLDLYKDGTWWLRVLEPTDETGTTAEVFRKALNS